MVADRNRKTEKLRSIILKCDRLAVAFSGGVDSSFLLCFAKEILGDKVIALTARAAAFSDEEMQDAEMFCAEQGIRQVFVDLAWEDMKGFLKNPPNRCYLCKKSIFGKLLEACGWEGCSILADGTNADDSGDYRPGMQALSELGIISPLLEAGLTKAEIREELRLRELPVWQKPAYACLATRVPFGEEITEEKLRSIGAVEEALHKLGFLQVRVRHHGTLARIEIPREERERFFDIALMDEVNSIARENGFRFAALDLFGYQMGNMNYGGETRG